MDVTLTVDTTGPSNEVLTMAQAKKAGEGLYKSEDADEDPGFLLVVDSDTVFGVNRYGGVYAEKELKAKCADVRYRRAPAGTVLTLTFTQGESG